ncbi:MAG: DUF1684 domain-containing protein [Candidatus Hodarchaeales archaeon]|jgi:uncharacterized protein (DUF1684 family)
MDYKVMIEKSRKEKDDFFRYDHHSPLTPEQKESFKELVYFPVNPDYRFRGSLDLFEDPELIDIMTNTGQIQKYLRYGKFKFSIGKDYFLTVYKAPDSDYFFVPFKDGTSGKESYGAGRYLELSPVDEENEFILDINQAYNPYCAYNESWTCPVPPRENWLDVRIEAGEKNFPLSDH